MKDKEIEIKNFVHALANIYTLQFDVFRDVKLDGMPLAFLAHYHRRDERYMITKKIKVYGVENRQVIFATTTKDKITEAYIQNFREKIEKHMHHYTIEHQEHMSTIVIGMIITNAEIDPKVVKEVNRFRKIKFLKFGLHGWAEFYLAIIQPHDKNIIVHSKGRPFVSSIEKFFLERNVLQ
ncbi:hypothetical protein ACFFIS_07280 [Virgibacillus soli]|uniref:DUF8052 domain-containing protein n=1 Tax=Paracerasibacillus soli TaxID=480284 RepID=A0ABU5CN07_9BACI|nr:hypothetical protein [Virgibacillus soli]MDY0407751.1 hypothetical protein [Virgibacillus soli]